MPFKVDLHGHFRCFAAVLGHQIHTIHWWKEVAGCRARQAHSNITMATSQSYYYIYFVGKQSKTKIRFHCPWKHC